MVAGKVGGVLAGGNRSRAYDVVFADPPYATSGRRDRRRCWPRWPATAGWRRAALVVVERSSRSPEPAWVQGITGERGRRYGETTLWYGRAEVL